MLLLLFKYFIHRFGKVNHDRPKPSMPRCILAHGERLCPSNGAVRDGSTLHNPSASVSCCNNFQGFCCLRLWFPWSSLEKKYSVGPAKTCLGMTSELVRLTATQSKTKTFEVNADLQFEVGSSKQTLGPLGWNLYVELQQKDHLEISCLSCLQIHSGVIPSSDGNGILYDPWALSIGCFRLQTSNLMQIALNDSLEILQLIATKTKIWLINHRNSRSAATCNQKLSFQSHLHTWSWVGRQTNGLTSLNEMKDCLSTVVKICCTIGRYMGLNANATRCAWTRSQIHTFGQKYAICHGNQSKRRIA